jgi:hypothetical protein
LPNPARPLDGGLGLRSLIVGLIMTLFKVDVRSRRMPGRRAVRHALLLLVLAPMTASAQIVEGLGSRALGMGGAFVAVANDSSATWWNPGALAEGPFLDAAFSTSFTEVDERRPAASTSVIGFSLTTPPAGISYYRWRLNEIPTEPAQPGREDEQGGIPLRSLSAAQIGVTLLHSLMTGVHAGATVKYVRGTLRTDLGSVTLPPSALLDRAGELDGGQSQQGVDVDLGVLAVKGMVRGGVLVRNLFEIGFEGPDGVEVMRLPRQVRIGGAFDADSKGLPLMVSVDVDVVRYDTSFGERRVVAFGAEHWFIPRRLAVRGGARFNTVGNETRAVTAGASVGVRTGLYVDGHLVLGGNADEQGWGLAARVSF